MPLDTHAQAFADMMAQWPAPDLSTLSVPAYREMINAFPAMPGMPVEGVAVEDRLLPLGSGTLKARIYRPPQAGVLPMTVYFHGGGFVIGSAERFDSICRPLAALAKTLVVSVDYRLAPEHKFPAAADDALAASSWLINMADSIGADTARVAVAGDSAGANLAAVVAQALGQKIAFQLLLYPVTDLAADTASQLEFANAPMLGKDLLAWFYQQYLPDISQASDVRASPLRQMALVDIAPACIITAECDPLRDQGEAYAALLSAAGAAVSLRRWDGQFHGFMSLSGALPEADKALVYAAQQLREALAIG